MLPTSRPWFNTLRFGLLMSAVGWITCFSFTIAPWRAASAQLSLMGASTIPYQPLLDYWLRMASAVFGCIGLASAIACLRPQAYESFIRLLGPFHFIIGFTLGVAAWNNELAMSLHPTFVPDIVFCFLTGTLISLPLLVGSRREVKSSSERLLATLASEAGLRYGEYMTDKQAVIDALERLPEGATLDEITDELHIMAAVRKGRADIVAGRSKKHSEVGQLVESWATAWTSK